LRNKLINTDKDVIEVVIPQLACFRALLSIRDILAIKLEDSKKVKSMTNLASRLLAKKKMAQEAEGEGEGQSPQEDSKYILTLLAAFFSHFKLF
jgi:hypothetical protein